MIISIGINDSQFKGKKKYPKISLKDFENNLDHFIKVLGDKKVILIGLTNIDKSRTTPISWRKVYYYNDTIAKYNAKIKEVAKKRGPIFIDFFGVLKKEDLKDGLHPNNKGHEKIFDLVKETLIKNKITK